MRKIFKRLNKTWFKIILFLIVVFLLKYFYVAKNTCTNPFEVRDYTSSRKEIVKVCNDVLYFGSSEIVDKKDYKDLFEYKVADKFEPTQQHIRIFNQNNETYVSILSAVNGVSWFKTSIGIYIKDNNNFKLIFKKNFSENLGRYSDIKFLTDETGYNHNGLLISGDVGYLGCYGCRINWSDYYNWDLTQQTFVISNYKHPFEFKKLLEEYEINDVTICKNEANLDESITNLYPSRNGKEKFCSDSARVPFTSSVQATNFLKAKKAIGEIISGKNISINEIKKIKLPD